MTTMQLLQIGWEHFVAGRIAEAERIYRQVLAREGHPLAMNLLGMLVHRRGQREEAAAWFRSAIVAKTDFPAAYNNLGKVLTEMGQATEAVDVLRRAAAMESSLEILTNLGTALQAAGGAVDELVAVFEPVVALNPSDESARLALAGSLANQGRVAEAIGGFPRLIKDPAAHSALICLMQFDAGSNANAIREEQRRWNEQHAQPLRTVRNHANDRDADRRLKVGYVSPDFARHVVGQNLLPLLRNHDRERFEIFCYSSVAKADQLTRELQSHADVWRDAANESDERLAEIVREDRIDVLVDLSLHMQGNRLRMFAREPAPVQVSFMGYPGATGVEAIGYRLSDPYLEPVETEDFWQGQALRLACSWWCYEPQVEIDVSALPALRNGYITFGSFNNFSKVNPAVLEVWAQVMSAVQGSKLIMLAPEGSARARVKSILEEGGVAAERVSFVGIRTLAQYMAGYHDVDVALDSWPYGAHTTGLDAFWMGVPVPTIAGQMPVGRAGVSHLNNLGMAELIAKDEAEFVRIVAELCGDVAQLAELRSGLRERMRTSPLMDGQGFARSIEGAYHQMWRQWCDAGR